MWRISELGNTKNWVSWDSRDDVQASSSKNEADQRWMQKASEEYTRWLCMRVLAYIVGVLAASHLLVLPTVLHYQALQSQRNEGLHHHELTAVLNAQSQENLNFGGGLNTSAAHSSATPHQYGSYQKLLSVHKRIDYLDMSLLSKRTQI